MYRRLRKKQNGTGAAPPLLSFRAGRHVGMRVKVLSSIDTLSREISRRHEACTISEWDFSTSLRSGRNDRDGGLPTVIHSKYGHSKKRGNEVPRFFDVPISSRRRGGGGK